MVFIYGLKKCILKIKNNNEVDFLKKILVFGMTQNPGGIESVIMNFYRNINRDKIQFDFLCNCKEIAYENEIMELGGKIYKITPKSEGYFQYKKELKSFFEQNASKYDGFWMNTCNLNNIDYLKYAKKYKISKRIIHAHNSKSMAVSFKQVIKNTLLHNFNKLFIKRYATDFYSCSNEASKYFYNKRIIVSNNYVLINNAIDTSNFLYNETISKEYKQILNLNERIIIGNIGRLTFQKNQEFVIDIFEKLHKKDERYVLLLIGQGEDEDKLKEKVKKLNLENYVYFLGVRNDVNNLLQAIDIFLFPSVFEGLPVTLIEAEASGTEIITSVEAFPNNTILTNNLIKLSLKEDIDKWVDEILKIKVNNIDRNKKSKDNIEFLQRKGFDIKQEAKKFENSIIEG